MADWFVGRTAELRLFRKRLDRTAASGSGIAVTIRGRRQIGKSRLVQEFCDQAGVPYFYFTAIKGASPVEAVRDFCAELRESGLPADPGLVPDLDTGRWTDAFRVLASVLPDGPVVLVLDELPWLSEQDRQLDGALQTAWDRLLSPRPVLLFLLGSDVHMMERLTAYDRPFFGRADNLTLGPLNPAEVADALGLSAADAVDAHLVCGGLPGILRSWPHGTPALRFIEAECADPSAPLFSIPESTLLAEFPSPGQARRALEAVGSGDRTQSNIAATAGGPDSPLATGSLIPLLRLLTEEKHILARDEPLSTRPGRPALYRVSDSNLRLYLAALRHAHELSRRGRPEAAFRLAERQWRSWRGRAVEPLIRQSLELASASGALPWPETTVVGGWWNRQFDPEVDLIGADRPPVARQVFFAGSVKWLGTPFDEHDQAELARAAAEVPGFVPGSTSLVVASRAGTARGLDLRRSDLVWAPDDVVSAWRTGGD